MSVRALKFAAIAAATAIGILFGSGPAHADSDVGKPCSPTGAKVWGKPGPIYCEPQADGQSRWVSIPPSALCVAFCVIQP